MKHPVLIEFVGLPGSGKTAICSCLREHAAQIGVDVIFSTNRHLRGLNGDFGRKFAGLKRSVRCALTRPKDTYILLKYGFACSPLSMTRVVRILLIMAFIRRLEIESARSGREQKTLVFEQGLVQMLGSLAVPGNINSLPDSCGLAASVVPRRISGLVLVDCTEETALSRVRNRTHGSSRFDLWSHEKAMCNMRVMRDALNTIVDATEKAGVRILRLDGVNPAHLNSAKVAAWLQAYEGSK